MYVVVNIQKEEHVLDLVKLLFQNGFPSVGVCDSLTDACPTCNAKSSVTSLEGTHLQQKTSPSKVKSRKRKASNEARKSVSPPRRGPNLSVSKARPPRNVSVESEEPIFETHDFDEEMVVHADEVAPAEMEENEAVIQPSRTSSSSVVPTKKVISPTSLELPARRSRRQELFADMQAKIKARASLEGGADQHSSRSLRANPTPNKKYISPPKLVMPQRAGGSRRQELFAAMIAQRKIKIEEDIPTPSKEAAQVYVDDDEELIEDVPDTSTNSRYNGNTSHDADMDTLDIKPDIKNTMWKNGEIRETVQCQMCNRKIIRLHQNNFINHLSRHCRLHASKQQFECGICGMPITRRYEVTRHIEQAHTEVVSPRLHIVDKGAELRDEYIQLLDKCFPGMRGERAGIRDYKNVSSRKSTRVEPHDEDLYLSDSS